MCDDMIKSWNDFTDGIYLRESVSVKSNSEILAAAENGAAGRYNYSISEKR